MSKSSRFVFDNIGGYLCIKHNQNHSILFQFVLRFDDDVESLSKENGLSIEETGKLLSALSKALNLGKGENVVLNDVKEGSYALVLTTPAAKTVNNLYVVHKNIVEQPLHLLTPNEIKYLNALKPILGKRRFLEAYSSPGKDNLRITAKALEKTHDYYFEVDDVYGVISRIGAKDLQAQTAVNISGITYPIKITKEQDAKLKTFYKKNKLSLTLRIKKKISDNLPIDAELLFFEEITDKGFIESMEALKSEFGNLFSEIGDSAEAVRKIRNQE